MDGMNCLLTFDKDNHRIIPVFGYFGFKEGSTFVPHFPSVDMK